MEICHKITSDNGSNYPKFRVPPQVITALLMSGNEDFRSLASYRECGGSFLVY